MNPAPLPLPHGQTINFAVTLILFTTDYMSRRKIEFKRTETLILDVDSICTLYQQQRVCFEGRHFDVTRLEPDDAKFALQGAASCVIDKAAAENRETQSELIQAGWIRPGLTVLDGGQDEASDE